MWARGKEQNIDMEDQARGVQLGGGLRLYRGMRGRGEGKEHWGIVGGIRGDPRGLKRRGKGKETRLKK